MSKPLTEMSLAALSDELEAAARAAQFAEFQDGLSNWRNAADAAQARKKAVEQEIDKRLAGLRVGPPAEEIKNGD